MTPEDNPLPMGWTEQFPRWQGHPDDKGTPQDEWDTDSPEHPRQEVRLWVRGDRYVRICEVEGGTSRYALHCGHFSKDKDTLKSYADEIPPLEIEARILMRLGGY